MKILLIDNHTRHTGALRRQLAGHDLTVIKYYPNASFETKHQDLAILSGGGGEGREIHDRHRGELWYKDELQFILNCPVPLLGICMGFELIAHAYGSKIERLTKGLENFESFRTKDGQLLTQYESHDFAVHEVSQKHFRVRAESATNLEIIEHRQRPMLGVQFHPELGGSLDLKSLVAGFTG